MATKAELIAEIQSLEEEVNELESIWKQVPATVYINSCFEVINIWNNEQMAPMLGFTNEEFEQNPQLIQSVLHQEDLESVYWASIDFLKDPNNFDRGFYIIYRGKHKNGDYHWFYGITTAFDLQDAETAANGISFSVDITEEIKKDKKLEQVLEDNQALTYQIQIASLSNREKEILQLITEGLTSKEMAQKLYRSLKTIEKHRSNIFKKLDCANAAEAMRIAMLAKVFE